MESIAVMHIGQLSHTTSLSGDLIYLINFILYNKSKFYRYNINSKINVGNYDEVVVGKNKNELT